MYQSFQENQPTMVERTMLAKRLRNIGLGLLLLFSVQASADALRVDFNAWSRDVGGVAALSFTIQNRSGGTLQGLQIESSSHESLNCSIGDVALVGFNFIQGLAESEQVQCRLSQLAESDQSTIVVTARNAQGQAVMQRFTLVAPRGAQLVEQGIVVLNSAAVHDDTNLNGLLEAGERIDYNYRLINLGTLALENLSVIDLDGGVACPASMLAVGADLSCSRLHVITSAEETAGRVDNLVEVQGQDSLGLPVQSSDLIIRLNLAGRAGIAVIKSPFLLDDADDSGFASLGDRIRYDFIVRNTNDETLSNVELTEPDPDLIDTPIVCSAQTLEGSPFAGNGAGVLEPGDMVLCAAEYEIRQSDVDAGQALNLVEVLADTPLNLSVQATGASALVVPGAGQLQVEKTTTTPVVLPNETVEFEISIRNVGSISLFDVVIQDPMPPGISSFSWTCAGTLCPNTGGSGAINESFPNFPVGELVVYTIQAVVEPQVTGEIVNTVSVLPPGVVVCQPGLSLPPCRDDVPVRVLDAMAVPALGPFGLGLLLVLMMLVGLRTRSTLAS